VNRPSAIDYVTGHAASLALTGGAASLLTAAWATQDPVRGRVHWVVPLIALLCFKGSFQARGRVRAYRARARHWQDARARAAGETQPKQRPGAAKRPAGPKARGMRLVLGAGIAALLWPWLSTRLSDTTDSGVQAVAVLFAGLTLWVGGTVARRVLRWAWSPTASPAQRRAGRAQERDDGTVVVCPTIPSRWSCPGEHDWTTSLPPYCKGLLSSGEASARRSQPSTR
jgi:hypothetical protein